MKERERNNVSALREVILDSRSMKYTKEYEKQQNCKL
jgi:hypothetical protein